MSHPVPEKTQAKQVVCFHDGDCPICELEINFMKKIDQRKAIQWVDINKDKAALEQAGITYQQAMDQIHVMDANGMKQGVDGFVLIWQELPYFRRLVPLVKLPVIGALMKLGYRLFAKYRLTLTGRKASREG